VLGVYFSAWQPIICHPTQVNAPCLNLSQANQYLSNLFRRDGRLSWCGHLLFPACHIANWQHWCVLMTLS